MLPLCKLNLKCKLDVLGTVYDLKHLEISGECSLLKVEKDWIYYSVTTEMLDPKYSEDRDGAVGPYRGTLYFSVFELVMNSYTSCTYTNCKYSAVIRLGCAFHWIAIYTVCMYIYSV